MSDTFLQPKEDVRPGLNKSHASAREHQILKKRMAFLEEERLNKKIKKTSKQVEVENRSEGLSKTIDSSNKGFAMLAKMGYKPGASLGKDGTGRLEPIGIKVKEGRSGLGREAVLKDIEMKKQKLRERRAIRAAQEFDPVAFRAQMREKHLAKRTESDLYRAQKVCRDLDTAKDILEPADLWFWPKEPEEEKEEVESLGSVLADAAEMEEVEEEEEDEEEEENVNKFVDEFTNEEMLEMIVGYLRTEHLYCLFCGIGFDDIEDRDNSCPGTMRDVHD